MLDAMRSRASSFLVTLLMGLLIASFAIWGIGDVFRFNGGNVVAKVGDATIAPADFAREFQNEVRRWQQQLGSDFNAAKARSLGLDRRVLARMVSRISFDQAAKNMGLRASNEEVRKYIAENKAFQNSFGKFDRQIYEGILQRIGFDPASFERAARDDLTRAQLLKALGDSAHVPDRLTSLLYTYRAEKRTVDILKITRADITDVAKPTDEQLRAYYKDHKNQFMAPEYRSLAYVLVTADDLTKQVTVSEDDLKKYYDNHLSTFVKPDRRVIEQIVLGDKNKAEQAYEALEKGEDFLSVAKKFAGLNAKDVKLGEMTEHKLAEDITPAAAKTAFAAKINVPTAPQQSAFGWHILRTTSVIPGSQTSLEQAHDLVEREASKEAAIDKLFDVANTIDDQLAGGASLEDVAQAVGVKVTTVKAVDNAGLTPLGKPAPNVPKIPSFLSEAFKLEPGAEPIVKEADSDGYYVLSVTGVTPRALKPFEDVRDAALANWTSDRRDHLAQDRADELAKEASGKSLGALAKDIGKSIQQDVVVIRDPSLGTADIAADVRKTAFATKPGAATVTPAADGDGFLVIKVKSRVPGDPKADAKKFATLDKALGQEYENDVLGAYQAYLERTLGFKVNEKVVEDTMNQIASRSN